MAGEDINAILGFTNPTISNEAQGFINQFVNEINGQVRAGRGEDAINFASTRLILVPEQFKGVDLSEVRKKVYEGRATA